MSDDPVEETVVHLRAAALEMITAARALLDLTEQLVKDPAPILEALAALASVARPAPATPADDEPASAARGPRPRSRVQHIRVS